MKIKLKCRECGSSKIKKYGKPEMKWGIFGFEGVNPLWIQRAECKVCGEKFGQVVEHWASESAMLTEIPKGQKGIIK